MALNITHCPDSPHGPKLNPPHRFPPRPRIDPPPQPVVQPQAQPATSARRTPRRTVRHATRHVIADDGAIAPPLPRTTERQRREGARSHNDRPSFPPPNTRARKQADHLRIQRQPLPHPASSSRRAGIAKNRRSPTKQPRQTTPSPIRQRMQHANPHQPRLRIEHGFGAKCPRSPPKTKGQQSLQPQTAPTRSLGFLRPGKTKRRLTR